MHDSLLYSFIHSPVIHPFCVVATVFMGGRGHMDKKIFVSGNFLLPLLPLNRY